ncbi:MAG: cobalt-precorrin-6A reductase [Cyanobacteria bacterium P01_A01_bin.40]
MNSKVWLIGGTSDSKAIAKMLTDSGIPFVVTVASPTAQNLYPSGIKVIAGSMDLKTMNSFCHRHLIRAVIDASHPYAIAVSRQAISVTTQLHIPYLRYERTNYQPSSIVSKQAKIIDLDSFEVLLAGNYLTKQKVFLTVGCQILPQFQSWQTKATLYARVLPKIESLKTALAAGFTSDRLIAIRPPISIETETALWKQWNISLVVTKASGTSGGEDIKHQVAANLGIPLIIVARPLVVYPCQTSAMSEVQAFCRSVILSGRDSI